MHTKNDAIVMNIEAGTPEISKYHRRILALLVMKRIVKKFSGENLLLLARSGFPNSWIYLQAGPRYFV